MEELGIPEQLISTTRTSMQNVVCKVKIDGHLSESFPAENGLRQEDALSCVLFYIVLDMGWLTLSYVEQFSTNC